MTTASQLHDQDLDLVNRRRRLKFRAWHRGIKEADLILGGFVDLHVECWGHDEIRWFERLFEENDQDILSWVTKAKEIPEAFDTPLMHEMQKLDFVPKGRPA